MRFGVPPPRFRLPEAAAPGLVRLQIANLDRSLAWYVGDLGMDVAASTAGVTTLCAGTDRTPLVELHEHPGARPHPMRGRLGLFHFALLLPDRAALGRLIRHLTSARVPMGMADHDFSESVYLTDPDGLGIEIYADRPRERWQTRGREVYATTEPLDVTDVVRSAGDTAWSGMPAGTHMGHVHLHVGDLDLASRFYHEALGFDRTIWTYPGALFVSAGGYHHHVGLNTWARGAPPAGPDDARLLEWELGVPATSDIAAVSENLGVAGFAVVTTNGTTAAADPWGTTVRLKAPSLAEP